MTCVRSDGREVPPEGVHHGRAAHPRARRCGAEEIALRVPDGRSVSVLVNASPIHAEDGGVASFVVTLQDMTPLEGAGAAAGRLS